MTLIDGDKIITTQVYDEQYEELIEKKMSIIDFVNRFSDEGATITDNILDKIRAEIDEQCDSVRPYDISCAEGLEMALEIIDKYKTESEK